MMDHVGQNGYNFFVAILVNLLCPVLQWITIVALSYIENNRYPLSSIIMKKITNGMPLKYRIRIIHQTFVSIITTVSRFKQFPNILLETLLTFGGQIVWILLLHYIVLDGHVCLRLRPGTEQCRKGYRVFCAVPRPRGLVTQPLEQIKVSPLSGYIWLELCLSNSGPKTVEISAQGNN